MRELITQNEMSIFSEEIMNEQFGKVRIQEEDGKYYFCAVDVCNVLGYANSRAAIHRHCDEPVKRHFQTNGGMQTLTFITESDLYSLIINSKVPGAVKFQEWLFDEVLPCIRKHGMYFTDNALEKMKEDPDWIYELAEQLINEKKRKLESAAREVMEWQ